MNGYYPEIVKLLKQLGFTYYRNGKGSHEVWVLLDNGEIKARIQVPRHLNDKKFANIILKNAGIEERL